MRLLGGKKATSSQNMLPDSSPDQPLYENSSIAPDDIHPIADAASLEYAPSRDSMPVPSELQAVADVLYEPSFPSISGGDTSPPMDPNPDGTRQNHFASGQYAERVRGLLNLLNDLHDLHATRYELSIPSVAVIGNQSTGKSSLIESICGISVPRDSGTCTRCPMRCEIRSVESSRIPWSATIYIEVASATFDGTHFRDFGPRIYEPNEVELWILRAQAAILNPHRDPSNFETLSRQEIRETRNAITGQTLFVSDKLVKIAIESHDAAPLTFIDLPGIMHTPKDDIPSNTPDIIRRLVKKHIRKSDTIILVTIPALDDFENHQAFQLARQVDPSNKRTLGVFTKTDLLSATSTNLISRRREDLDGDRAPRGALGYFAVRLPDDTDRGLSSAEMGRKESELFEVHVPWRNVRDRGRLGVRNLVTHVGGLLADLVDKRLPTLKLEVEEALSQVEAELSGLPPEPDWTRMRRETKLHLMFASFTQAVKLAVFASDTDTNEHMSFVQHNINVYKRFAENIKQTQPGYAAAPESYMESYVAQVSKVITDCTTWELPGNTPYLALKKLIREFTAQWKMPAQQCFDDVFGKLSSYIKALAQEHFKEFPVLRDAIIGVVETSITARKREGSARVMAVWQLEDRVPLYTLIQDVYQDEVKRWRQTIQDNWHNWDAPHAPTELMAKALAYYGISSKRFIDYAMLTIEADLNQSFSDSLHTALLDEIASSSTSPPLAYLMAEDPALMRKRMEVKEKLDSLRGIQKRLFEHDPGLRNASGIPAVEVESEEDDEFRSPPAAPSEAGDADSLPGTVGGPKTYDWSPREVVETVQPTRTFGGRVPEEDDWGSAVKKTRKAKRQRASVPTM